MVFLKDFFENMDSEKILFVITTKKLKIFYFRPQEKQIPLKRPEIPLSYFLKKKKKKTPVAT